jgi:hypothetical protein
MTNPALERDLQSMFHRYLRYAKFGVRILLPSAAERRYERQIRASNVFDRDWYLSSNPRLPRLCRFLPERHYVLVGEVAGLCPSPDFSPRAYSHLNPDQTLSGQPPLAHYIAKGHAEGRRARDLPAGPQAPVLPVLLPDDSTLRPARHAIVLHLYYRDMWEEIAALITKQQIDYDLFVTLVAEPDHSDLAIRARILAAFPNARIWTFPNHGRDILPFLHLAQSGLLSSYAAVCKLHTKRSPHREDGDVWRQALFAGVLGDPVRTKQRLSAFKADPKAGFWVADGNRLVGRQWWGPNAAHAALLIARAGLHADRDRLIFAAGSIYWVTPALLQQLAALPVNAADFEPEMGQVDGTMAHALERIFGLVALRAKLCILQTSDLETASDMAGSSPEQSAV